VRFQVRHAVLALDGRGAAHRLGKLRLASPRRWSSRRCSRLSPTCSASSRA
jgi:hypothetical protein